MAAPGKEVFRGHDEYGSVSVFDDGVKRYLAFGSNDEQSCILKADPCQLQHDYARAMMLALLFVEPKSALVLGVGGGCLLTALHQHIPGIKLRGVELRQQVVDIAYKYFQMPRSKRMKIIVDDANQFLMDGVDYHQTKNNDNVELAKSERETYRKTDLVFADLYTGDGMELSQSSEAFIDDCKVMLKPAGWLVLNCWTEHRADPFLLSVLKQRFEMVYVCSTVSGNWIILAGLEKSGLSQNELKDKALKLSQQFGFSFTPHLKRLSPQN